jgi:pimeloyl-ACP methyl ester carboxylesterase
MTATPLVSQVHTRRRRAARPPILLVPGSYSGAWIWQHNFQASLHRAGHDVHAMSFAAHGQRGLALNRRGLDAYVADLRAAVAALPAPPVLVAHSLGGLVALKLAATTAVRGLALLAPIPAQGAWRSVLKLGLRSPASLAKLAAIAIEPRLARYGAPPDGIYGDDVDPARASAITASLQAESLRVLIESLLPSGVTPARINAPLHFFAAGRDTIIPAAEVERCARAFNAPYTLYPDMGHTFQAERGYERVSRDIVRWIGAAT